MRAWESAGLPNMREETRGEDLATWLSFRRPRTGWEAVSQVQARVLSLPWQVPGWAVLLSQQVWTVPEEVLQAPAAVTEAVTDLRAVREPGDLPALAKLGRIQAFRAKRTACRVLVQAVQPLQRGRVLPCLRQAPAAAEVLQMVAVTDLREVWEPGGCQVMEGRAPEIPQEQLSAVPAAVTQGQAEAQVRELPERAAGYIRHPFLPRPRAGLPRGGILHQEWQEIHGITAVRDTPEEKGRNLGNARKPFILRRNRL